MAYFSGQGKLYAANVTNGSPGPFRWLGNVPALSVELKVDTLEHKESHSGQRLTDLRIVKEKSATFKFALEDIDLKNLSLALYGTETLLSGATITGEALGSTLPAAGDLLRLARPKVSALTLVDSTDPTPKTLAAGTNYRLLDNGDYGLVEILNLATGGPFEAPLKASYTAGSVANLAMFSAARPELWLRFEGLNTADSDRPVLVELYRAAPDPLKGFDFIGDDVTKLDIEGGVLADMTKNYDAALGLFGRIVMI